ncbi:hypothetical protein SNR37_003181 [Agarivorans aestuarii]|uniref:Lipoprotein n=1 Tax=Agarivorans aestuarii TaxID=1563703 RepID=A0ABU7G2Y2_9ALTE|nr:hypothetical protein [Agarivorans aestuarii]MEE1673754.1 hypothetical protein [Agarivorans aestuarii]
MKKYLITLGLLALVGCDSKSGPTDTVIDGEGGVDITDPIDPENPDGEYPGLPVLPPTGEEGEIVIPPTNGEDVIDPGEPLPPVYEECLELVKPEWCYELEEPEGEVEIKLPVYHSMIQVQEDKQGNVELLLDSKGNGFEVEFYEHKVATDNDTGEGIYQRGFSLAAENACPRSYESEQLRCTEYRVSTEVMGDDNRIIGSSASIERQVGIRGYGYDQGGYPSYAKINTNSYLPYGAPEDIPASMEFHDGNGDMPVKLWAKPSSLKLSLIGEGGANNSISDALSVGVNLPMVGQSESSVVYAGSWCKLPDANECVPPMTNNDVWSQIVAVVTHDKDSNTVLWVADLNRMRTSANLNDHMIFKGELIE